MTMKRSAARLEKADQQATQLLNGKRSTWWVRAIGAASDIGDQPQMRVLCAAAIAVGMLRRDKKLALTGVRMLAAHTVATWGKGWIKDVIDRTRPNSEQNGYTARLGSSHVHSENSFPSGHSAGIVAVAQVISRNYPKRALAARTAAGAVAGAQVARGEHFIGDVLIGSLIGIGAEYATDVIMSANTERPPPPRACAPFTVAVSPTAAGRTAPVA